MHAETRVHLKNPFDSRQLLAFVTLARTGSFTQTGRELFLTQSPISHSIRALERDAGCALMARLGKKVLPTPAGEYLLYHAEKALGEIAAAREILARTHNWPGERLRLGASAAVCQYILPPVLRQFTESFPRSNLAIHPADTSQVLQMFEQDRIDLAFCLEPQSSPGCVFEPLFSDELCFIVHSRHACAIAGRIDRTELLQENLILHARTSCTFRLVQDYFAKDQVQIRSGLEVGNIETMKELVKLGLGIAILPRWVALRELSESSLVALPLGPRKLRRCWGILRREKLDSSAVQKLIALCRAAVPACEGIQVRS